MHIMSNNQQTMDSLVAIATTGNLPFHVHKNLQHFLLIYIEETCNRSTTYNQSASLLFAWNNMKILVHMYQEKTLKDMILRNPRAW